MSISALTISVSGIMDGQIRLDAVAHNIANMATEEPMGINDVTSVSNANGQGVSTYIRPRESVFGVDLASELVNVKLAEQSVAANAKAASIAGETLGTLIDMVDTDD